MSYAPKDFKRDLEKELSQGYDVVRIARMAFSVFHERCREIDPDLANKMFQVIAMEEGPEFELSEEQLREFARSLAPDESL